MIRVEPGQRYVLPSGSRVEVLAPVRKGYMVWSCAYLREDGTVLPPGGGYRWRVTLSAEFLALAVKV